MPPSLYTPTCHFETNSLNKNSPERFWFLGGTCNNSNSATIFTWLR